MYIDNNEEEGLGNEEEDDDEEQRRYWCVINIINNNLNLTVTIFFNKITCWLQIDILKISSFYQKLYLFINLK